MLTLGRGDTNVNCAMNLFKMGLGPAPGVQRCREVLRELLYKARLKAIEVRGLHWE